MAKRKHHKKHHTRRRRVSGMGKLNVSHAVTQIAGVAVGAAAAGFITSKILGGQSPTIKAIAPIALGIATPMFLKSDLGQGVGNGMVAVGVINLLRKSGFVSGIDDALGATDDTMSLSINGTSVDSAIAGDFAMAGDDMMGGDDIMGGYEDISVLAGIED